MEGDLSILFEHQTDQKASRMAAFVSRDPSDLAAFLEHWRRILSDPTVAMKTILWQGRVAGIVGSFLWDGKPQVTYWIGKEFWGNGIATQALREFLRVFSDRPVYASAAKDNVKSAAAGAQKKARSAATTAQKKVSSAAGATASAAKEHPYAAAGIAAGVAAAVAGGAYAATRLGDKKARPAKAKPAKAAPKNAAEKK